MADNFVQLVSDLTNSGKLIRTQDTVVGANTVHMHYFILADESGNAISSTLDSVRGANTHITNATIEKTIGSAIGTLVILSGTSDGTNAQAMRSDTSGRPQVVGNWGIASATTTGDKLQVLPVRCDASQLSGLTDALGYMLSVDQAGRLRTRTGTAATSTLSNVSASASNVTVLAANTSRLMATFYNDSSSACYLKFGATASTSSFTVKMAGGGYYELVEPLYTGIVDGIWDSATGNMRVTELT